MVIVLILVTQTPQVCVMTRMIQFYNNIGCEQFSPAKLYGKTSSSALSIIYSVYLLIYDINGDITPFNSRQNAT